MNNILTVLNKMDIDIAYIKGVVHDHIITKTWKDLSKTHPYYAPWKTYEDLRVLSFVNLSGEVLTRFPVDFASTESGTDYRGEQSLRPAGALEKLREAGSYTNVFLGKGELKRCKVEAIARMAKDKLTMT
jgi:hypothetical protein